MEALQLRPLTFTGYQVEAAAPRTPRQSKPCVHLITPTGAPVLLHPAPPPSIQQKRPTPTPNATTKSSSSSAPPPPPRAPPQPSSLPSVVATTAQTPVKNATSATSAAATRKSSSAAAAALASDDGVDAALAVLTTSVAVPADFKVEFVFSSSSSSSASSVASSSRSSSRAASPPAPDSDASGTPADKEKEEKEKQEQHGEGATGRSTQGEGSGSLAEMDANHHQQQQQCQAAVMDEGAPKAASVEMGCINSDDTAASLRLEHGDGLRVKSAAAAALDAALTQCALRLFNGTLPQQQQQRQDEKGDGRGSQAHEQEQWTEAAHYHRVTLMGYTDDGTAMLMAVPFVQAVPPPQSWRLCPLPLLSCPATQLASLYEAEDDGVVGMREGKGEADDGGNSTGEVADGGEDVSGRLGHRYPVCPRTPPPDSRGPSSQQPPPLPAASPTGSLRSPQIAPPPPPASSFHLSPPLRWSSDAINILPALDLAALFGVRPHTVYRLQQPPQEVVVMGVACGVPWVREVVPGVATAAEPSMGTSAAAAAVFPSPPAGYRWKGGEARSVVSPLPFCYNARDLRGRYGLLDEAPTESTTTATAEEGAAAPVVEEEAKAALPAVDADATQVASTASAASAAGVAAATAPSLLFVKEGTMVFVPGPFGVMLDCVAKPAVLAAQFGLSHGDRLRPRSSATAAGKLVTVMGLHKRNVLVVLGDGDTHATQLVIRRGAAEVAELFERVGEEETGVGVAGPSTAAAAAAADAAEGAEEPPASFPASEEHDRSGANATRLNIDDLRGSVTAAASSQAASDVAKQSLTSPAHTTSALTAGTQDATPPQLPVPPPQSHHHHQLQQHHHHQEESIAEGECYGEGKGEEEEGFGTGPDVTTPDAAEGDPDQTSPFARHAHGRAAEGLEEEAMPPELPANAQAAPMFASTHRTPTPSASASPGTLTPREAAMAEGGGEEVAMKPHTVELDKQAPALHDEEEEEMSCGVELDVHVGTTGAQATDSAVPVTAAHVTHQGGGAEVDDDDNTSDRNSSALDEEPTTPPAAAAAPSLLPHAEDVTITSASVTPTTAEPARVMGGDTTVVFDDGDAAPAASHVVVAAVESEGEEKEEEEDTALDTERVKVSAVAEHDTASTAGGAVDAAQQLAASSLPRRDDSYDDAPPQRLLPSFHPRRPTAAFASTGTTDVVVESSLPQEEAAESNNGDRLTQPSLTPAAAAVDDDDGGHECSASACLLSSGHTPSVLPTPSASLARRLLSEPFLHDDEALCPPHDLNATSPGREVGGANGGSDGGPPRVPLLPLATSTAASAASAALRHGAAAAVLDVAADAEAPHTAATVITAMTTDESLTRSSESPAAVMPESYYAEIGTAAMATPHVMSQPTASPAAAAVAARDGVHAHHPQQPQPGPAASTTTTTALAAAKGGGPLMNLTTPPTTHVTAPLYHEVFTPSYSPPAGAAQGHTVPRYTQPGDVQSYNGSQMQPSSSRPSTHPVNPRLFSEMAAATTTADASLGSTAVTPAPFTAFLKAYAIFRMQQSTDDDDDHRDGAGHPLRHRNGAGDGALPGLAPLLDFYRAQPVLRITAASESQRRCRAAWAGRPSAALQLFKRHASTEVFDELCVDELVTLISLI